MSTPPPAFRKIMILPDTDTAREFVKEWKLEHPTATNVAIKLEKHCEGKQITIDYDEEISL